MDWYEEHDEVPDEDDQIRYPLPPEFNKEVALAWVNGSPDECPYCGADAICFEQADEQFGWDEVMHLRTIIFYYRCHACENEWYAESRIYPPFEAGEL